MLDAARLYHSIRTVASYVLVRLVAMLGQPAQPLPPEPPCHTDGLCHSPLTLTVHSVTTARDLVPPRKGETRSRTSHGRLASNNIQTLGRLNAGRDVSVVVRMDTDLLPEGLRQAAEHAAHSGDL